MIWQIASATGWSVKYILRGVNYQTLLMMLSDAPRYITQKGNGNKGKSKKMAEGFFRSRINK
jgi:hypothetical protein